jgi:2-octaprenylphenol hydroxylase
MHSDATDSALDMIYDIVVVGAGMVGLTAALALQQSGFSVLVVDGRDAQFLTLAHTMTDLQQASDDINSYDNRVSALTRASQNILDNLGVWDKIAACRLSPYQRMKVWDGEGTGHIDFSSAQLYEDSLGHIVENSVVLAALISTCQQRNITIESSTSVVEINDVNDNKRVITCQVLTENDQLKTVNYSAKVIVGADGAMSKIRQLAAIELWQHDYGHHAIVATVATTQSHQNTAWQRFTATGPLAFLPLANKNLCSIVWSTTPEQAAQLMAMDEGEFSAELARAFEQRLGKINAVSTRAVFPLRHRHAKHYVQAGLALVGDAAHTIHPLAGQGVNLGLLDVAQLAQVLKAANDKRSPFASYAILKRFERARYSENLKMLASMQGFKWLFDPQPAPLIIARNLGMKLLNKAQPVKQHIMMQAMGLSGDLPMLAQPCKK